VERLAPIEQRVIDALWHPQLKANMPGINNILIPRYMLFDGAYFERSL